MTQVEGNNIGCRATFSNRQFSCYQISSGGLSPFPRPPYSPQDQNNCNRSSTKLVRIFIVNTGLYLTHSLNKLIRIFIFNIILSHIYYVPTSKAQNTDAKSYLH